MPRKTPLDNASLRRAQLLEEDEFVDRSTTIEAVREAETPSNIIQPNTRTPRPAMHPGVVQLWKNARHEIMARDNNLSWELTQPPTFIVGPAWTVIPFDNENIGGQGARSGTAPHPLDFPWYFQPPPKYAGKYRLAAYLEFRSGAMHAMTAARLEVWLSKRDQWGMMQSRLWRVLDSVLLDYRDAQPPPGYLTRIVLGNSCLVPVACDEKLTVRLYHNNVAPLVLGGMNSVHSYVDLNWCGTQGRSTDLYTQPYLL